MAALYYKQFWCRVWYWLVSVSVKSWPLLIDGVGLPYVMDISAMTYYITHVTNTYSVHYQNCCTHPVTIDVEYERCNTDSEVLMTTVGWDIIEHGWF